jgi:ribosomal protein S18 acetylase RimI-like enzyme
MTDQLIIRSLARADIPGIASWVAATQLWQRYNVTEASFAERLTNGLANGATIFVATRANEVLGFVWLVARGAFNRSAYIQLIGVRPNARASGVGRVLMEFAEAHAPSRDIFLLVSDFNTDAQNFYARLGYVQVGKLDDYVVQGVSELVMWKKLDL